MRCFFLLAYVNIPGFANSCSRRYGDLHWEHFHSHRGLLRDAQRILAEILRVVILVAALSLDCLPGLEEYYLDNQHGDLQRSPKLLSSSWGGSLHNLELQPRNLFPDGD